MRALLLLIMGLLLFHYLHVTQLQENPFADLPGQQNILHSVDVFPR